MPQPSAASSPSPGRRAWLRFKRNRLGYWSLVAVQRAGGAQPVRRGAVQRQAAGRALRRPDVLPGAAATTRDDLRRRLRDAGRLPRPVHPRAASPQGGNWALYAPNPYGPKTLNYFAKAPNPAAPSRENWLGTDDRGRDLLAQLIYGFRVSVLFALALTVIGVVLGVRHRRGPGLLRRQDRPGVPALHRDLGLDARAVPADHLQRRSSRPASRCCWSC